MAMTGTAARSTSEKLQPLAKPKMTPEKVIAKAKMIAPIFSPRAFCMLEHSLPSRDDSSAGFIVSNHALSCLRIASRYLVRVFFTTRSLNNWAKEYMTKAKIQTTTPVRAWIKHIVLVVAIVLFRLLVGPNESMMPPMRNTKDGIPTPVITDAIQQVYISALSAVDAN